MVVALAGCCTLGLGELPYVMLYQVTIQVQRKPLNVIIGECNQPLNVITFKGTIYQMFKIEFIGYCY